MNIEFLSLEDYLQLGLKPSSVFGSADFLRLNAYKADRIVCAAADKSIGIVFGEIDGELRAPWSAPYMSVDTKEEGVCDSYIHDFGKNLRSALKKDTKVRLITPPEIYGRSERIFTEAFRVTTDQIVTDTSFYIKLAESESEKDWNKSARRNLRRARNAGLQASLTSDYRECYDLIASHHEALGYNMAMTAEQVYETSRIIPVDFWVVKKEGQLLAAMYCYRVRRDIVQVISSGDTPAGREMGAAMFMERAIIDYYRELMINNEDISHALLDHGPTSVGGIQNEGLASFKTSFGCIMTPKITLKAVI